MSGRELFAKYSKTINFVTMVVALLPVGIRKRYLHRLRYKDGSFAMLIRYLIVRTLAKRCGDNVAIFPGVYFENIDGLEIGSNVSIHQMCYIDAEGGISIGDDVSLAHRVTVLSSNHIYKELNIPIKYQGMFLNSTIIEDNVWIGCSSVVLAGVTIHSGSIVGANSTVTHDVSRNTIVVGTPAKVLKIRG